MAKKTKKSKKNDSHVLLYCQGRKALNDLITICSQRKHFWIVRIANRNDKTKINKIFEKILTHLPLDDISIS